MKMLEKQLKRSARKKSRSFKLKELSDNEVAKLIQVKKNSFLYTEEWRTLRKQALEKYGYVCVYCGREHSRRFPINVDHIKPRKFFPELALDINNLQPLCGTCNKRKGNKF